MAQGEKILNAEWEFGSTAGLVYNYLKKFPDHKANLDNMVKDLGLTASIAGMSWLAGESKLGLSLSGKDTYAFLHPDVPSGSGVLSDGVRRLIRSPSDRSTK